MKMIIRGAAVAALALTVTATSFADSAEARSRRAGAAIVGGLVIGGLIAGAAAANARERVYVREAPNCREFRNRAVWNEENGSPRRAAQWWQRYEDCKNGY